MSQHLSACALGGGRPARPLTDFLQEVLGPLAEACSLDMPHCHHYSEALWLLGLKEHWGGLRSTKEQRPALPLEHQNFFYLSTTPTTSFFH
jgi:hypothetical protein